MTPQYLKPSFSDRMAAAKDLHRANGTSGGKGERIVTARDYAPISDKRIEAILTASLYAIERWRQVGEYAAYIGKGDLDEQYIPF